MLAKTHKDLDVYKLAFGSAISIYKLTKDFRKEELYSLTDQIRRSSRSVCANIAEAFRKRKYEKHFVSKLSDAEAEAAETQVWLEFAIEHAYITKDIFLELTDKYEHVISMIVRMKVSAAKWTIR